MRIFLVLLAGFLLLGLQSLGQTALPAFIGAQGFGAVATGGRGGRVIAVTNLRSNGAGSLQDALNQSGARTIVFRVSGVIEGVPIVSKGDVTIAGQTSPNGITVRGLLIEGDQVCEADGCPLPSIAPSNVIVRFLRSRASLDGDGLRLHRAKKIIVDHFSVGNATDEAMQISFSSDVTIQNSLLAETIGEHNDLGGMLLNYADPKRNFPLTRISVHHNVWTRIGGRIPELSRENPSATGSSMDIEISNNVFHDHTFPIWFGNTWLVNAPENGYSRAPIYYRANLIGNYSIQNPSNTTSVGLLTLEGAGTPDTGYLPQNSPSQFFLQDNQTNLVSARDWQLLYCCNDFRDAVRDNTMPFVSTKPPWAAATRLNFPNLTYTPVGQLLEYSRKNVGMRPWDAFDTRVMKFVVSNSFDSASRNLNLANDALLKVGNLAAPKDTDSDGMSDTWEVQNGLNPRVADQNATQLSQKILGVAGYTNLEVYLEGLTKNR
jgi:pectate lyase